MATKKTTIAAEIKVDTGGAEKEVKDLKDGIQGIGNATEGSIAQLKELKKQLKNTAAGSEEFQKLYNQIDDLEDKIKGSKKASSDWIDTLESAGGPLGMIGGALNKAKVATTSFSAALKASGIGLLVSLVAGLAAAFAKNEGAMKKLEPIMTQFGRILNGILGAMQPLIDTFIDLATKALPYVTNGFKVAYSAMSSFLQGLGLVGSAVKKFISGDFSGAWDDAKKSVTEFGSRYEAANKRFIAGSKELTDTEKAEQAKRLADQKAANEKAAAERKAAAEKKIAEEKAEKERQAKERKEIEDFDLQVQQRLLEIQEEKDAKEAARIEKAKADAKAFEDFDTQLQQRLVQIDQEAAEKKKAADDAVTQNKISNANAVINILGNLNEIAGASSAISKGLALTQIGIDTAQAISALVKNSEQNPFNAWTFGSAGLTQFLSGMVRITANIANAKRLLSSKVASVPSPVMPNMPRPSIPSVGGMAPLSPSFQATTLNQAQVNQIGNVAARAYVVESDISGNQERIIRLNRAARIS
jgi:ribosomal protein S13